MRLFKANLTAFSSIKAKVAGLVIGVALVSCLSVGLLSYQVGKDGLVKASELRLAMIARNDADALETHFARVDESIDSLSQNNAIGEAVKSLGRTVDGNRDAIVDYFQTSRHGEAARIAATGLDATFLYGRRHGIIHKLMVSALKNNGYSDMYLIANDGTIIYTVTKGPEFLRTVDAPGLSVLKTLKARIDAGKDNRLYSSGFVPYPATDGKQSIFVGRPVYETRIGRVMKTGDIIVRIGIDKITALVTAHGKSSAVDESMMIRPDGQLRTARMLSRFGGKVPPALAVAAKTGKTGVASLTEGGSDYYYAYQPVDMFGTTYLMAVGQKADAILASAHRLAWSALWVTLGVIAVMALVGAFFSGTLTRPLVKLSALMNRLNAGDTEIEVSDQGRRDEIGVMASALQSFKSNALEKSRMEAETARHSREIEEERARREEEKVRAAEELQHAVDALAAGLRDAASGNLTARIDTPFVGALDQLRLDFNHSMEQLDSALEAIGTNSTSIRDASAALEMAAHRLSQRTESQASALEEAAAALTEITATIRGSSASAEEAGTKADQTKRSAEQSVEVVGSAVAAMERIETSSQQIRSIVGVIDEIAFQTNLLALNAGVEASRAGDAGRGFAVVAQEVRELAQRSATAAKEIGGLIANASNEVESGVALVRRTGDALAAIQGSIEGIHTHIQSIVLASREQRSGIEEVSESVTSMDRTTQQNAAMAEETAASVAELARETHELNARVAQFATSGSSAQPISRAA